MEGELLGALPPPQKKEVFLETFPKYGLVGGFTDLGKFSLQKAFFLDLPKDVFPKYKHKNNKYDKLIMKDISCNL